MVVFTDGQPDRKLYRRFKIRSHERIDDYASMREALSRRLKRTEWDFPDLIVLDGGKGQLFAVLPLLADIGSNITLVAIAKENEEIFTISSPNPLSLPKRSYALRLLQRLRDEAHRFANDYRKRLG